MDPVAHLDASAHELDWARELARLYDRPEEITLVHQPVADLHRGVVCGFEALARFPRHGTVGPGEWFQAAARHGISGVLESHVVRAAIAQRAELPPNCFLSLNVSPGALLTPEVQAAFLSAERLDKLVVDVTEQVGVEEYDALVDALEPLREAGASIAVDDAGSGYTSLVQIARLRPDFVKVDRDIISGCHADEAKRAALEAIGSFAAQIDAWVVAEGIESIEELDALVALRVPLGQGYLLGRPVADMGATRLELGPHIRERAAARAATHGVAALVEEIPPIGPGIEPQAHLLANPHLDTVVTVDGRRRPTAVATRESPPVGPPLIVAATSAIADVARRAMERPRHERFLPVVCCDVRSRYLGVVRVERLVAALAD